MSRWVTFYEDVINKKIYDFKVHKDKETALKYFNRNCTGYFQINVGWKAKTLPATYGFYHRRYVGMSKPSFEKIYDMKIPKEYLEENK